MSNMILIFCVILEFVVALVYHVMSCSRVLAT